MARDTLLSSCTERPKLLQFSVGSGKVQSVCQGSKAPENNSPKRHLAAIMMGLGCRQVPAFTDQWCCAFFKRWAKLMGSAVSVVCSMQRCICVWWMSKLKKKRWSESPVKESSNHHSLVHDCIFNSYEEPSNHRLEANKLFPIVWFFIVQSRKKTILCCL